VSALIMLAKSRYRFNAFLGKRGREGGRESVRERGHSECRLCALAIQSRSAKVNCFVKLYGAFKSGYQPADRDTKIEERARRHTGGAREIDFRSTPTPESWVSSSRVCDGL